MGFDYEYKEDYFKKFSKYLELKNIDYIILIINFNCRRISDEFRKIVVNLIKIFTSDKLYNHFCTVFTHFYPLDEDDIIKKEKLIENFNETLKYLFQDKNKNFNNNYYFVDTYIHDKNNNFDEKSQENLDIMLEQIKLDIDFFGSIN